MTAVADPPAVPMPIQGVSPAEVREAPVMTVWPSVAKYWLGQQLGKGFAIRWPDVYIFRLGNLLALLSIPIALKLYFFRILPYVGTRYLLTNRRVVVLRGITGVGGIAVGMIATRRLEGGLLAMAAGWTAVLCFYDLPRAARILEPGGVWPRWRPKVLGRLTWRALPLGIVTTLGALMATVPSVMIEKYRGAAELGIYTALAYAFSASHRIMTAMSEAASARLARHHAAGRRDAFLGVLSRLLVLAGVGGLAGVAVAAFAGRQILTVVYGPVYGGRADLLVDLMIASTAAGLGVVLDYAMTAMGRLRIQPLLTGTALVLLAALTFRLIPVLELRGAVIALGVVSVLQGLSSFAVVSHGLAKFPSPERSRG